MIRYYICNLEISNNFTVDDISFEKIGNYTRNIRILKDKHRDQLTCYAREETSKPSSFLRNNPATSVNDIMILLSLAQSRNIYYSRAKDSSINKEWRMPLGGKRQENGHIVITEVELSNYLNSALHQISRPDHIKDTGLDLAIFWWLESIYANRPLETKFVSAFIALEILANSYCLQHNKSNALTSEKFESLKNKLLKTLQNMDGDTILPSEKELISNKISSELNRLSIKEKIRTLREAYDWSFINDQLIKDWVDIRNKYTHEGSVRALKRFEEKEQLAKRYIQIVYSVQIALLELLGINHFIQRNFIIKNKIQDPEIRIVRDAGPFKVTT